MRVFPANVKRRSPDTHHADNWPLAEKLRNMRISSCHHPQCAYDGGIETRGTQMTITYALAMAAGKDAANRQMKANGRTAWNEEDFNLAAQTVAKLLGA